MQKMYWLSILLILLGYAVIGQNIVVNPYLQDAEPNAITIMWEADADGKGFVDWGNDPFTLNESLTAEQQVGNANSIIQTARLTDLIPNSKYYYRVRSESGMQSYIYHFKTPDIASSEKSIHLMAVSDMQRDGSNPNKWNDIVEKGLVPIVFSEIDADLNGLDALIVPGDLVVTGGTYAQWKDQFFNPADSITPYVPLYPVPGNHEYFGGGLPNFIKYFSLPENGPVGLEEEAWYKDISNVRIIGLNSNSGGVDQDAQLVWLQALLNNTCGEGDIDFVFAQLHHPFKSELWTPGENSFTGEVIVQLENFTSQCNKASVHFFGHTHGYSRGQSRDHSHLWVNVATAGGAIDNWGEFPNADYDEFNISQDEYGFVFMSVQAGSDPEFTLKRFTRGDELIEKENELVDSITIRNNNLPLSTPMGIFPNGDTIEVACLRLKASDFNNAEMIHQATHWQIASSCDFTDSLVTDIWKQNENWYDEVNTQMGDDLTDEIITGLDANKSFCWRVRYRNEFLTWSDWSLPVSFETKNSGTALTGNVILNGGAESGTDHWTGDIETLISNECNSVPVFNGSSMFAVGGVCTNEQNVGLAFQTYSLVSFASQIDAGELAIFLKAAMRDFNGGDVPEMYIEFYSAQNNLLETTASISNATASWIEKSMSVTIPAQSRSARFVLKGTRNSGSDNDSYFDEVFAQITTGFNCSTCFTSDNNEVDMDEDGFCADLDCNDQDSTSYPGALEICDQKDNNCDGKVDSGFMVSWTGDGDGVSWEDDDNWDQDFIPLTCQHVLIDGTDSLSLQSSQTISSLEISTEATLTIAGSATLMMNKPVADALIVYGKMINNGQVLVRDPNGAIVRIKAGSFFINRSRFDLKK